MTRVFTASKVVLIVVIGVVAGIAAGAVAAMFEKPQDFLVLIAFAAVVGAIAAFIVSRPASGSD